MEVFQWGARDNEVYLATWSIFISYMSQITKSLPRRYSNKATWAQPPEVPWAQVPFLRLPGKKNLNGQPDHAGEPIRRVLTLWPFFHFCKYVAQPAPHKLDLIVFLFWGTLGADVDRDTMSLLQEAFSRHNIFIKQDKGWFYDRKLRESLLHFFFKMYSLSSLKNYFSFLLLGFYILAHFCLSPVRYLLIN